MLFDPQPRERTQKFIEDYEAPLGDVLGAVAEDTMYHSPVSALARIGGQLKARGDEESTLLRRDDIADIAEAFELEIPAEGIRARELDLLIQRRQMERRRNQVLARSPSGVGVTALKFATGLAASALDPINVASAFIPVVGQGRYAAMLGRQAGRLGRAGVRARVGIAEGAVGAASVEPFALAASSLDQGDYGLNDALLNIVFGTALGGGLHVGAGAIADAVRGGQSIHEAQPVGETGRALSRVDPATRAALQRVAIAEGFAGRRADLDAIAALDPRWRAPGQPDMQRAAADGLARADTVSRETFQPIEGAEVIPFQMPDRLAPPAERPARLTEFLDREDFRRSPPEAFDRLREAEERLAAAEARAAQFRRALESRSTADTVEIIDEDTAARLAEIDAELRGNITRKRRDALERERAMLVETLDADRLAQIENIATIGQRKELRSAEKSVQAARRAARKARQDIPGIQAAWEAGYFSGERAPTVQEFLDAVREDFTGNPKYSANDRDLVEAWMDYENRWRALDEFGIDPRGKTEAQVERELRDALTARAGDAGVDLEPVKRQARDAAEGRIDPAREFAADPDAEPVTADDLVDIYEADLDRLAVDVEQLEADARADAKAAGVTDEELEALFLGKEYIDEADRWGEAARAGINCGLRKGA